MNQQQWDDAHDLPEDDARQCEECHAPLTIDEDEYCDECRDFCGIE